MIQFLGSPDIMLCAYRFGVLNVSAAAFVQDAGAVWSPAVSSAPG